MSKENVFMFSGQGSQYYHMGEALFENDETFRRWMLELDGVVRDETGESAIARLYDREKTASDELDDIAVGSPALFMVQYALAQTLIAAGVEPSYVLGASLGEFVAAAVAAVVEPEVALRTIVQQASVFSSKCRRGGMLGVVHDVGLYRRHPELQACTLAAVNFGSHFVLSGSAVPIEAAAGLLKGLGVAHQVLPVRIGFHSSEIDAAQDAFVGCLDAWTYCEPRCRWVSCSTAEVVRAVDEAFLWEAVRGPIRFPDAFGRLEQDEEHGLRYIDAGPSGTLAAFARANKDETSDSEVFAVMTRFARDLQNMERIRQVAGGRVH